LTVATDAFSGAGTITALLPGVYAGCLLDKGSLTLSLRRLMGVTQVQVQIQQFGVHSSNS